MNWRLCLLILVLLPLLVVVAKLFGRRLQALSTRFKTRPPVSTLVEEVIAGIRVVKSFVQSKREEQRFVAQVNRLPCSWPSPGRPSWPCSCRSISLLTFSAAAAVLWYGGQSGHRRNRVTRRPVCLCAVCRHSHRPVQFGSSRVCADQGSSRSDATRLRNTGHPSGDADAAESGGACLPSTAMCGQKASALPTMPASRCCRTCLSKPNRANSWPSSVRPARARRRSSISSIDSMIRLKAASQSTVTICVRYAG